MKIKFRGTMRSNPSVALASRVGPVRFSTHVEGGASGEVGELRVAVSEVPLRLRIPFLKRRHGLLLIGAVGPMELKVDPLSLALREVRLGAEGVLGGKEGLTVVTEGKVACESTLRGLAATGGDFHLGPFRFYDDEVPAAPAPDLPKP